MIFNLLEDVATGSADKGDAGNNIGTIIIMIVLVVAIIGLFIWQTISNKKRQKEAQNMVDSIKVGDRVKTIGGICGFIVEIRDSDNTFVLRTGLDDSSDYIRFDKVAIYQTAPADGGKKEAVSEAPKAEEQPAAETESDK